MWRCPNCGQRIDDNFDVCWKCGTGQDGSRAADFQAEASDPHAADDLPLESAVEPEADRLLHQRLVEVCSAGSIVEADGLSELLEEAGIHARVVGEGLGVAAGGLALGEDVSPRIWVYENELDRAREVIDRWRLKQANEPIEFPENEALPESETPVEAEYVELPSDVRLRFLSQGFFMVGAVCIVIGRIWAWQNSMVRSIYAGTAIGRLHRIRVGDVTWVTPPRERDVPPGNVAGGSSFPYTYDVEYAYVVNGKTYDATMNVDNANSAPNELTIHYDPRHPASNIAASITPPWMILLFASLVGAFLCFVRYQFR